MLPIYAIHILWGIYKVLHEYIFTLIDSQTDRQTDRRIDRLMNGQTDR